MKQKLITFIKKETVLAAATILAIISAFFVHPSAEYITYIDFRVLGILLSLMIVMAGFQANGLFDTVGSSLLRKTKNSLQLSLVLVFLCFFFSMIITNDVSLITFVPFAILTLKKCGQEKLMIPVIVLQTIAANLGSMLTPIGNPQNLYLYNLAELSVGQFMKILLPYTVASGVLLLVSVFLICRKKEAVRLESQDKVECKASNIENAKIKIDENKEEVLSAERQYLQTKTNRKNIVYTILFLLSLLVVARILPFYIALITVVIVVFFMDRPILKNVDYSLLLTFVAFFVFTGNMGKIETIEQALQQLVMGREIGIGILASQVISNVPAALLLSGFTSNYQALLIGVNVGGLGTLIASMASLISYKIYAHNYNETKGKYFIWFTIANILFLAILVIVTQLVM